MFERFFGHIKEVVPHKEKKEKTFDEFLEDLRKYRPSFVQVMPVTEIRDRKVPTHCSKAIFFASYSGIVDTFQENYESLTISKNTIELGKRDIKTFVTAISRALQIEHALGVRTVLIDRDEREIASRVIGDKVMTAYEYNILPHDLARK